MEFDKRTGMLTLVTEPARCPSCLGRGFTSYENQEDEWRCASCNGTGEALVIRVHLSELVKLLLPVISQCDALQASATDLSVPNVK